VRRGQAMPHWVEGDHAVATILDLGLSGRPRSKPPPAIAPALVEIAKLGAVARVTEVEPLAAICNPGRLVAAALLPLAAGSQWNSWLVSEPWVRQSLVVSGGLFSLAPVEKLGAAAVPPWRRGRRCCRQAVHRRWCRWTHHLRVHLVCRIQRSWTSCTPRHLPGLGPLMWWCSRRANLCSTG